MIDTSGDLFGVLYNGGAHYVGQIFELVPNADRSAWTFEDLYDFGPNGIGSGVAPTAGLTYAGASSGKPYDGISPLYGTTSGGGYKDSGVVYSLQPNNGSWTYQPLYKFCSQSNCWDGNVPLSPVVLDASGNLYGTTYFGGIGGIFGAGTVFELSPSGGSWNETVLYRFCSVAGCADGADPQGGVAMDGSGTLYGVAPDGGKRCLDFNSGCGVAYKLVSSGTSYAETVLHTFCTKPNCADGALPEATPSLDAMGNIFGTAIAGGDLNNANDGAGVVFELTGSKFRVRHTFCQQSGCPDGHDPLAGLITSRSGHLLGTTGEGGAYGGGAVYEFTP